MQKNILGLTVLRSPIYGDFRLGDIDYEEDYDIISQGISEGKLRIDFNRETWKQSEAFLNQPIVIVEANHKGKLPTENSYYSIKSKNVSISVIKKCEYDDSVIVRLFETSGMFQRALLCIGNDYHKVEMQPFEIKTIKITGNSICECYMTEDL